MIRLWNPLHVRFLQILEHDNLNNDGQLLQSICGLFARASLPSCSNPHRSLHCQTTLTDSSSRSRQEVKQSESSEYFNKCLLRYYCWTHLYYCVELVQKYNSLSLLVSEHCHSMHSHQWHLSAAILEHETYCTHTFLNSEWLNFGWVQSFKPVPRGWHSI